MSAAVSTTSGVDLMRHEPKLAGTPNTFVAVADDSQKGIPNLYFTPNDVSSHNAPDDCWVSFLGHVYDLTPLMEQHKGTIRTISNFKN